MNPLRHFKSPSLVSSCQQLEPDMMNDFFHCVNKNCLFMSPWLVSTSFWCGLLVAVYDWCEKESTRAGVLWKHPSYLFASHTWHNPWFLSLCICKIYLFKSSNMARLLQVISINWRHWYIPVQLNQKRKYCAMYGGKWHKMTPPIMHSMGKHAYSKPMLHPLSVFKSELSCLTSYLWVSP